MTSIDDQLTLVWEEAKEHLRGQFNDVTFRLWFERTIPVSMSDGVFVVGAANEFAREWLETRFGDKVRQALAEVMATDVAIRVVVDERAAAIGPQRAAEPPAPAVDVEPVPPPAETGSPAPRQTDDLGLNPRYIFDRFVVGSHNEYASAVARSVAESPAVAYNPVFIYAGTGLGKTHLIQAIAHETVARHPGLRVKYVTVEQFTDEFINAVTDKGRIEGFKQQYRTNDVLLIDDVQFLAEKQQTQVEFFHTFNSLYEARKQIVITSDRPPRELEELEERLRSRFGQGIVVDIGRPDLETRIAILRKQVKWEGYKLQDQEVLEFIAGRVSSNIRELEGALTRVVSFASVTGTPVTLEVAREALKGLLPQAYEHPLTIDAIQGEVARQFGCYVNDLRGDRRSQDIAYARQIAMYLARELTDASLPQIGARFGGRDHTTVLYAVNKIKRLLNDDHDRQLHELIQLLTSRLKAAR
ncbi:MAG TPA: chromosomal replication initiator protein DnaA [Thermoleophilia bacterium]|nr:chromosomal replication initiator protein DnaA [Thermoleophilia bacterium]